MIRIIYYRNKCIGCNSCSDHFPHRWTIDEQDGKVNLIGAASRKNQAFILKTSDDEEEEFILVAEDCPVNSIEVSFY